jgi:uncharacterized protein YkwD
MYNLLIVSYSALSLNFGGGSSSSNIDSFVNGMMDNINSSPYTTTTTTISYSTTTTTKSYAAVTTKVVQANYAVAPAQAPAATTYATTVAPSTVPALNANVAISQTASLATTTTTSPKYPITTTTAEYLTATTATASGYLAVTTTSPAGYPTTTAAAEYSTAASASATPSLLPLSALTQEPFDIQQMACLVNYQRQLKGSSPLTISSGLNQMALQHSNDQAQMQNMTHTGLNGSTLIDRFNAANYPSQYVAENVAWNQRTVADVVQAWVNSPGHYANMINPDYTEFGAACVNWYWTFDFGSSAGQGNTVPNCSGYQIP